MTENLEFFASAYGLAASDAASASTGRCEQFELEPLARLPSGQLPGGFKQRLAMAAALLHEPEILFLDEPTSGADPLARREFWRRITALAEQGVTVIVTTHFMEEAEYCDRMAILDAGRVLAQGTPAEIRRQRTSRTRPAGERWKMHSSPSSKKRVGPERHDKRRRSPGRGRERAPRRSTGRDRLQAPSGRQARRVAALSARRARRSSAIRAASPSASSCR